MLLLIVSLKSVPIGPLCVLIRERKKGEKKGKLHHEGTRKNPITKLPKKEKETTKKKKKKEEEEKRRNSRINK